MSKPTVPQSPRTDDATGTFCSLGTLGLLGCASLPAQPDTGQPYGLLVFQEAVRLVALDAQTLGPRVRSEELRVTPGPHRLRFAYAGSRRACWIGLRVFSASA